MTKLGNVLKGVAIGDAWGDPNEFVMSIQHLTDNGKNPMGPELPKDLHVTDDTQMTLYLATALEAARGQDMAITKEIIAQSYLNYYNDPMNDGSRAPGGTVMGALGQLNAGKPWQEATIRSSDGSGTVMRTSPMAFLPDDGEWVGKTAFAAAVTHGHPNAIAAAILNVAILRELLAGDIQFGGLTEHALTLAETAKERGLLDVGEWLEGYEVPNGLESGFRFMTKILAKALPHLARLSKDPWAMDSDPSRRPIVDNGGWRSPFTLVIALLSIDMLPNDPWLALRRSVTTEGDSDTVGAVTGALLGAGMSLHGIETFETFNEAWSDLEARFEPEYQRWINEAQNYDFTKEVVVS